MVKYLVLFLFCLALVGCNPLKTARKYTRHYVLGVPLEEPTPEATPTPLPKDFEKEAAVIVEITPKKKVYNLLNGYLSTPETSLKNMIVAEFNRAEVTFKTDDPELISYLNRFGPLIQDNNVEALEIMVGAYSHLDGANKEAIGFVLALGLDYMLPKTIELYFAKKKENACSFAGNLNKSLDHEQKILIYKERRAGLALYSGNSGYPDHLRAFAGECDKAIQLELLRLTTFKKTLPDPEDIPPEFLNVDTEIDKTAPAEKPVLIESTPSTPTPPPTSVITTPTAVPVAPVATVNPKAP